MLELFILGFALAATPGPDFVLIVDQTLAHGRRTGYLTLAGNRASLCLHLTFALLGLSAILVTSPSIYVSVRLLGAAYLVYFGTRKFLPIFGAPAPNNHHQRRENFGGPSVPARILK